MDVPDVVKLEAVAAPAPAPSAAAAAAAEQGVMFSRSVLFGSIAFWLGPKRPQTKTHSWTVFVRGPYNEDLSYMLRDVEFHLHESFEQPVRVVRQPPFEVTEVGWGEFEIRMVRGGAPVVVVHSAGLPR